MFLWGCAGFRRPKKFSRVSLFLRRTAMCPSWPWGEFPSASANFPRRLRFIKRRSKKIRPASMPGPIWPRPSFSAAKKRRRSRGWKGSVKKIPRGRSAILPAPCSMRSNKDSRLMCCPASKKYGSFMKNGAVKIAVSCCCLLLLFAACNKRALYHDLSEGEANEILVVLQHNDISAGKIKEVRQNEVFWSIEVSEPNLSKAQAILLANNLPRKRELGLTGVYKEKGLIPTPDEQKARFLLALKGEIINSLEKLPEVVDADVVLNVPTKEEFAKKGETERPTASVVIKAKAPESGPSQINEMKIQEFV